MIQLFLIDVRLAFNSGERAYIFNSKQRWEAVLITEEESIDEKKRRRGHSTTVEDRMKSARGYAYFLMGAGLHVWEWG